MKSTVSVLAILFSAAGFTLVSPMASASATPTSSVTVESTPAPVASMQQSEPWEVCWADRDGETIVWDGWVWECTYVMGDDPEWQWEPIRPWP